MKFSELTKTEVEKLATQLFPKVNFQPYWSEDQKEGEIWGEIRNYEKFFKIEIYNQGCLCLKNDFTLCFEREGDEPEFSFNLRVLMDWMAENKLEFE